MEQGQNMLRNGRKIGGHSRPQREHSTKTTSNKHGMGYATKNKAIICQDKPEYPLRWHLNDLSLEVCTMAQTWSMRQQLFKALREWKMQAHKHRTWTKIA